MMWDRIFRLFSRSKEDHSKEDHSNARCDEDTSEKAHKRRELERREQEARRMNDALEDLASGLRDKSEESR